MTSSSQNTDARLWKLVNEFTQRMEAGENPTIEQYCQRHPDLAEEIADLFPTVIELEAMQSAPSQPSIPLEVELPDQIGDYKIVNELGRGGMGVVYKAEHLKLGRKVALKVLPSRFSSNAKALTRFRREGKAIAKMHHTNIVPLFEVGEDQGIAFLAMQLIQGQSLDFVIKDLSRGSSVLSRSVSKLGPDSGQDFSVSSGSNWSGASHSASNPPSGSFGRSSMFRKIAHIGLQAADALSYAHQREVVHRDVKPSNLIYDESGVVWLTDFGLAKLEEDEREGMTQTGDMVGTLKYMAPKRFAGRCDATSDIYSLGLTLYELLTHQPAFQSSNKAKLISSITQSEPARPRSINPRIPRDLETIVLKATNKEPGARYKSARAMSEDLGRFLRDEPIKARRVSWLEHTVRWAKRNKRLAAALAFLAAFMVFAFVREGALRRTADSARVSAEVARGESEQRGIELQRNLYFAEMNLAGQSALDPYGAPTIRKRLRLWHPDQVGGELRGWEWFYLHALSHRERFTSKNLGNSVWSVDVSTSGKEFVNVINGWGIQVRDMETGEVLREKELGSARFVEFSPDGQHIAAAGFGGNVNVCNATTMEVVTAIVDDQPREVFCVDWSPDGKRIATCGRKVGENFWFDVWDPFSGELIKKVDEVPNQVNHVQWSPDGKSLVSFGHDKSIIWDTETWESAASKESAPVGCFSPDGKRLVVSGVVYDVESDKQICHLSGGPGYHMSWRPGASEIAIADGNGAIRIVDANSGRLTRTLLGHTSQVRGVSWSPDGTRLVSGSLDCTVRTWDLTARDQNQFIPQGAANSPRWSHDGDRIALSSTWENNFSIWDNASGEQQVVESGSATEATTASWSTDDRRVAYSGRSWLKIYDCETGKIKSVDCCKQFLKRLDWSADGSLLAGAEFYSLHFFIIDPASNELILEQHDAGVHAVDWHPKELWLAVGYEDGQVKLMDKTGNPIWSTKYDDHAISDVRFSRDGTKLASAGSGAIVIWDAETGKQLHVLDDLSDSFGHVAWSHDGRQLVSSSGSSINVWDVESGKVAIKLVSGSWAGVDWSPDGKKIVAGNYHHGYRIWDATAGYEAEE